MTKPNRFPKRLLICLDNETDEDVRSMAEEKKMPISTFIRQLIIEKATQQELR
jgi:hypothetical protein